jgi:HJR/Mrr/RecB family endonuclease
MSKKDFVLAAGIISEYRRSNGEERSSAALDMENAFVDFFSAVNNNFNERAFRLASTDVAAKVL